MHLTQRGRKTSRFPVWKHRERLSEFNVTWQEHTSLPCLETQRMISECNTTLLETTSLSCMETQRMTLGN